MIKPKLTLLQMQSKSMFGNTIELRQAALCKTPEGFNTVNMTAAFDKLIVAMINPKVFAKANIHQAIVATPAIGIDDAQRVGFTSDNRLQSTIHRPPIHHTVATFANTIEPYARACEGKCY